MNKSSDSAAPKPDRVRELRTRLAHHIASFVGHQENLTSEIRGLTSACGFRIEAFLHWQNTPPGLIKNAAHKEAVHLTAKFVLPFRHILTNILNEVQSGDPNLCAEIRTMISPRI